jgi:hypothetical protein
MASANEKIAASAARHMAVSAACIACFIGIGISAQRKSAVKCCGMRVGRWPANMQNAEGVSQVSSSLAGGEGEEATITMAAGVKIGNIVAAIEIEWRRKQA